MENLTEKDILNKREEVKEKEKKDPHLAIISLQVGVTLVILIIFLVIKLFFGDLFLELKGFYDENIGVDTDISQVLTPQDKTGMGGPQETLASLGTASLEYKFKNPLKGTVTSKFGIRPDPFTGENSFHGGVDIAAAEGSEIFAVMDGVVEKVSFDESDYGNYLIINHQGIKTLYAHCSSIEVKEGREVSAGEIIARCGNTGRSTGPHLHFELRVSKTRIDPLPFLDY